MKTVTMMIFVMCVALWATAAQPAEPVTKPADAKVRVGVYDSRAVLMAFVDSDAWKNSIGKELAENRAAYDKAKAKGDKKRPAELDAWGNAVQVRLHRQSFGTVPVDDILKHIEDKLPQIAKAAGVGPIVSRWDTTKLAKYKSAEQVDITMALVDAFRPTKEQRQKAIDIQKQKPSFQEEASRSATNKDDESRKQLAALKDKEPRVRLEAVDAVRRLGNKVAVEPLIGALKDVDSNVRRSAARALGTLGDRRAVEPLITALNDRDSTVRYVVIETLGLLGDKRAVKPLRAGLTGEGDSENEAIACTLAALVRDETTVAPLLAALEHPASEWTHLQVFGAFLKIGPPAVKPLAAALPHSSEKVRRGIVQALTYLDDEQAVEPLIKTLNDPNGNVARAAACGLGHLDDPRAVAPLAAAIRNRRSALWRPEPWTPWDQKTDRLPELAVGMPEDLTPLVSAMEDPHWQLRAAAAWLLGRLGDKRADAALVRVLNSAERAPTLDVQWLCGQALARLQSPLGIAPMVRVFKEHDAFDNRTNGPDSPEADWFRRTREKETVRLLEAIVAIGPAAVGPLIGLLKHESPAVRAVAAHALGKLGDKRALEALNTVAKDADQRVREAAIEAIRQLQRKARK